ncbi:ATP-dependent helicase FUN30 [Nakaseomyces glabratus]|nr:ATP-dependent helicase FUN30 [Nakaseomyces glabratus]KTB27044.1 ATP-dependent helicase FUN30 [Nakaseomyces glabratus]
MSGNEGTEGQPGNNLSPVQYKTVSSSPLKPEASTQDAQKLREQFVFKPNNNLSSAITSTGQTASSATSGTAAPVNPNAFESLVAEFPDFSQTLVQAVYKSNSFDLSLARERLTRIRNQRKNWVSSKNLNSNVARGSRAASTGTGRLSGINNTSDSSKIVLEKQKKSIFDRYSSAVNSNAQNSGINSELFEKMQRNGSHKKRKLVRGDKLAGDESYVDSSNSQLAKAKQQLLKSRNKKFNLSDDEEEVGNDNGDFSDASGDEYEEHTPVANIDDQILEFLNNSEIDDIMDLGEVSYERAKIIQSARPFTSLYSFSQQEFLTEEEKEKQAKLLAQPKKRGRRGAAQRKEGEKVLDRVSQAMRGYNAIESVIKTCSQYGKLVSSQIKKWGVKVDTENGDDGELDFINVGSETEGDAIVEDFSSSAQTPAPEMSDSEGSKDIKLEDVNKKLESTTDNNNKKDGATLETASEPKLDTMEEKDKTTDISVEKTEENMANVKVEDTDKANDDPDSDFQADEEMEFIDEDEEDEEYDEELPVTRRTRNTGGNFRKEVVKKNSVVKFFRGRPKLLNPDVSLKDYQQTGINWLNLLYHNQISCILADDMGLGKTCQVISFLAYLKQIGQPSPHLIVVPSSTLENWLREFQKFCPSLKIEPYYGTQQERADLREILERNDGKYDVIVTTYNLAAGNKYDVSFLKTRNFNVVVYDEGHMLKNSMSERFNKLMRIHANFRLLLTGTPLQNNLKELMSLLEFIMPNLFVSKKESLAAVFKQRAKTSDDNKGHNPLLAQQAITRAKTMMKPFILRRRKDQVLKHLPAKHVRTSYCAMNDTQREIYNREVKLVMEHKQMIRDGTLPEDKKERSKIENNSSKNLIMSLRKASIHPLLFRHIYDDAKIDKMCDAILDEPAYAENGNKEYIREDMSFMTDFELHRLCCNFPNTLGDYQLKNDEWMNSGKVDALKKLLDDIINKKREKVLIFTLFTQVLDILEKVLSTLNYKFLRLDGSTQVNDRQTMIDKFYDDNTIPIFMLSTRAGGFGINLVCANHVIIFDQSFNPHDDRQAADRAHRVGQTKEVTVTTLITKDSIEEKIFQLAKTKLALDSQVSSSEDQSDLIDNKVSDLLEDIIYTEAQKK